MGPFITGKYKSCLRCPVDTYTNLPAMCIIKYCEGIGMAEKMTGRMSQHTIITLWHMVFFLHTALLGRKTTEMNNVANIIVGKHLS